jgi:hypothetical protein
MVATPPAAASLDVMCGATPGVAGTVASTDLVEISGIASSRAHENVLWAHNDSGDTARVFAMDTAGAHIASFEFVAVPAVDWEAMGVGPGPDEGTSYLYMGDIGDNNRVREEITVYRAPEPPVSAEGDTPVPPNIMEFDALTLRYPDGAHDAEALMIDPVSGDLIIVTKNIASGTGLVFRADGQAGAGAVQPLERVAEIDFSALRSQINVPEGAPNLVAGLPHIPTAGDITQDGSLVTIRTYGGIFIWTREEGTTVGEAFAGEPCLAPAALEQQGEAIAFNATGTGYITISEGMNPPINEFVVP